MHLASYPNPKPPTNSPGHSVEACRDAVVAGSTHCSDTLRVREFLTRNGHPYSFIDHDQDAGIQELLDQLHIGQEDVSVLSFRGEVVLRNPTNQGIADGLGFNAGVDPSLGSRPSHRR